MTRRAVRMTHMGIGVIFTVLFFLEKILYGLVALAGIALSLIHI